MRHSRQSARPAPSRARWLAGVAAATMLLAACGGNSPTADPEPAPATTSPGPEETTDGTTDPATTDAPPETTAAPVLTNPPTTADAGDVPQSGGSVRVALDAESTGWNPHADAWANSGHNVARAIFDTLAARRDDGAVVPYLAESITGNEDATVWTITLRPGVTFHNGEPLDADAVRLNFEAVQASPQYSAQLALLSTIEVVDELTLQLTMSAPWGTFPNVLVGDIGAQAGYMAAPAMLAAADGNRNPIGTGPFVFEEWVPDDRLIVVRNDAYWQDAAYLDQIEFRPIPDATSRKAAFDAGDVDVYYTGDTRAITEYLDAQAAGEVGVVIGAPSEPDVVMFNTSLAPLDDVRVRRALAMSVDIPRLYEYLDATGVKQPLRGPYADSSFWFEESDYPAYDPEQAASLIAEYEAEVGPVAFDFVGGQDPFIVGYQELFQSMWSDIGAEASIVSQAQSETIEQVVGGNYQVVLWGGIGGGDPDNDYDEFHSGPLNFSRFTTPTIDAAMAAGRALSDQEARREQYAIVQQELGDAVPYIWTGTNQFAVITGAQVAGVADFDLPDGSPGEPVTGGRFFLKDVWLRP
jgi:4-phytase/acid phosphatase/peptide/nickel transport system substrate-binding protein